MWTYKNNSNVNELFLPNPINKYILALKQLMKTYKQFQVHTNKFMNINAYLLKWKSNFGSSHSCEERWPNRVMYATWIHSNSNPAIWNDFHVHYVCNFILKFNYFWVHHKCVDSQCSDCVIYHYIRWLETLESLKINTNDLITSSILFCDDMYLCQVG